MLILIAPLAAWPWKTTDVTSSLLPTLPASAALRKYDILLPYKVFLTEEKKDERKEENETQEKRTGDEELLQSRRRRRKRRKGSGEEEEEEGSTWLNLVVLPDYCK